MPRVVIFVNGSLPENSTVKGLLHADDILLGADGGTRHILALGLMPFLVIGDLDSLSEDEIYELGNADVRFHQYPEDKDETDLELTLQHAVELRPTSILVIAALGGRLDQTLGNLSLLSDVRLAALDIRIEDGVEEAFFCRDRAEVRGSRGDVISLIPWNGDVSGVTTAGLKWPLHGESLFSYKTRGLSNELVADAASIQVKSGLLLVVHRRKERKELP